MSSALDYLLGQPWAIEPNALDSVLSIAQRANESPEAVAAKLGRPLDNARRVRERDATAIIPITGPIFRRANLFTEISGATSVEVLATDIRAAADDPAIARIVLEIDSPGGQATGISELAAQIRAVAKPVIAYVDGMAASAAYWLASAADEIVADKTALLGSIGVVASYKPEKDGPIKIISAVSPLKHATPDTDDGRAELQRIIDELAAVFVADVALYRAVTADRVIADFGRGSVLLGTAAVHAASADRLGGFESLFAA
jgi:ClpP class serine protease